MPNALSTFSFRDAKVRVLTIDGNPWFLGIDVCRVLGVAQPTSAYRRLLADEVVYLGQTKVGLHGGRDVALISESGLYRLVMRSDKPQARAKNQCSDYHAPLGISHASPQPSAPEPAVALPPRIDGRIPTAPGILSPCQQFGTVLGLTPASHFTHALPYRAALTIL